MNLNCPIAICSNKIEFQTYTRLLESFRRLFDKTRSHVSGFFEIPYSIYSRMTTSICKHSYVYSISIYLSLYLYTHFHKHVYVCSICMYTCAVQYIYMLRLCTFNRIYFYAAGTMIHHLRCLKILTPIWPICSHFHGHTSL